MVKLSLPESELTLWPLGQPRLTAADNAGELPGCELPALTMSLANPTPLGMSLATPTPLGMSLATPTPLGMSLATPTPLGMSLATPTLLGMSLATPTLLGMPLPNSTPSKRPTQTVIVRQRLDVRRELNGSAPP